VVDELDAKRVEFINHLKKIASTPRESIEGIDKDDRKFAAPRISEERVNAGALGLAAQISEIAVDATQFKSALSSDVTKLNELRLQILFGRRGTAI
jgi:hypothetical protein